MSPDLTILIPLYNEESCLVPNVGRLLYFFRKHHLRAEIILGSNGSTDATRVLGRLLEKEATDENIRFFHIAQRGAVGEVFRRAVGMASSPVLISMDMDLSVDLDFILKALSLLKQYDLVVGSKQSGSQMRTIWRKLGSGIYILCARHLLKLPYDDYSLGAKAYRIKAIQPRTQGISHDTNYVLDLLYACHHAKLPIAVLPVACEDWRTSRFNLTKEALVRFQHLFSLWLE